MKKLLLFCLSALLLVACGHSEDKKEENVSQILKSEEPVVDIMVLKTGDFSRELISNGNAEASKKADLNFPASEEVTAIYVSNGDRVSKGQKIASQDTYRLRSKLVSAKSSLDQAYLSLQDELIGRGYDIRDTTKVPASEMQLLRTKSGYDNARETYQLALYDYNNSTLYAPFDGTIANLFSKEHNIPSTSEPFCTVIGSGDMNIDFSILEGELPMVKKGREVEIMPFISDDTVIKGRITAINPVVDKNGLVRIKATADNSSGVLYDGMNVRVSISNTVPDKMVVPKTAMVLRSNGRSVVFTYKNGRSFWNYIEPGEENSRDMIVKDGLKDGDTVIVTGNMNLAHDVPVKIGKIR
ncbi:MAG: efflux RND transporter periplasmic adaptor subunit [Flavobacteriales bacterium]|nr:MAG: efflux RND transporter periplasmic adaptor subunit [Flavobacteriales bacterium]